jgi:putative transposase
MVDSSHESLSMRRQCALLGIWRSRIYYKPIPDPDESILANEIHEIWLAIPFYGYRRITAELQRRGYDVNHKRIARIMKSMHIQALYPRPKTTTRNPDHKIYPYLLRDLEIIGPNHVWATDITYIRMPEGFMYLVALIDLHSRFIIGWNLSNSLDASFCEEVLKTALVNGKPVIINTDQGSQFTGTKWIELVEEYEIKVSMDGRGRWADNIFIERFWRSLKHEHILLHEFETVGQLRASIEHYIDIYNNRRLHQSLGYKTPAEVYYK